MANQSIHLPRRFYLLNVDYQPLAAYKSEVVSVTPDVLKDVLIQFCNDVYQAHTQHRNKYSSIANSITPLPQNYQDMMQTSIADLEGCLRRLAGYLSRVGPENYDPEQVDGIWDAIAASYENYQSFPGINIYGQLLDDEFDNLEEVYLALQKADITERSEFIDTLFDLLQSMQVLAIRYRTDVLQQDRSSEPINNDAAIIHDFSRRANDVKSRWDVLINQQPQMRDMLPYNLLSLMNGLLAYSPLMPGQTIDELYTEYDQWYTKLSGLAQDIVDFAADANGAKSW